jgi:hypothetical protein
LATGFSGRPRTLPVYQERLKVLCARAALRRSLRFIHSARLRRKSIVFSIVLFKVMGRLPSFCLYETVFHHVFCEPRRLVCCVRRAGAALPDSHHRLPLRHLQGQTPDHHRSGIDPRLRPFDERHRFPRARLVERSADQCLERWQRQKRVSASPAERPEKGGQGQPDHGDADRGLLRAGRLWHRLRLPERSARGDHRFQEDRQAHLRLPRGPHHARFLRRLGGVHDLPESLRRNGDARPLRREDLLQGRLR